MPSTHTSIHFHIIFSTKNRVPMISDDWRERLHSYIGGIIKGLGGVPIAIGGTNDHIHLLIGLKTSHRLDYFIRDIKADSSEWVHKELQKKLFSWQKGYAVIAVSPDAVSRVKQYVLNQKEHHRKKSFQEEYIELLKAAGIEYDERYLW